MGATGPELGVSSWNVTSRGWFGRDGRGHDARAQRRRRRPGTPQVPGVRPVPDTSHATEAVTDLLVSYVHDKSTADPDLTMTHFAHSRSRTSISIGVVNFARGKIVRRVDH